MSMMPTAMILDAGFASLPLQQAIKAAGFRTLACSGKAQDAGMKYADATWAQNYADSEAVLAIARQEKITALSPGVTEFLIFLAAAWRRRWAFPAMTLPR